MAGIHNEPAGVKREVKMAAELASGYDVVCIGGALIGSSAAYFLSENPDFDGSIVVIEPDSTYDKASSSRAQNSIREQFSNPLNIRISQFGMEFIADFHDNVQVGGESPAINFVGTGYMFVAGDDVHLKDLSEEAETQLAEGADVRILTPGQVADEFPYMNVETIAGARLGSPREGSLDGWSLLQGYKQRAIHNGVTYLEDRVVGIDHRDGEVAGVELASGRRVDCGYVINAAGPRASLIAEMVGLQIPVEPRARTSFVFACRTPIDSNVPLTVLPEGPHYRRDQAHFMCGAVPIDDHSIDFDDLDVRHDEFEQQIWPVLAHYVPAFDRIALVTSWGGQYAFNTLDHNLIIGPAVELPNFIFANGFSGHGLQQSPAVGRGLSELVTYGRYTTIDMTPLGYDRIARNEPFLETAII